MLSKSGAILQYENRVHYLKSCSIRLLCYGERIFAVMFVRVLAKRERVNVEVVNKKLKIHRCIKLIGVIVLQYERKTLE